MRRRARRSSTAQVFSVILIRYTVATHRLTFGFYMKKLVLAPHPDDETIGLGGTIAKAASNGDDVVVCVITGHGEQPHPLFKRDRMQLTRDDCKKACDIMGVSELMFTNLPTTLLDMTPIYQINKVIDDVVKQVQPDELYIPFTGDLHKDHGSIAYAAMVSTRPYLDIGKTVKRVLAYETLSETHLDAPYFNTSFQPNYFVDISDFLDTKVEAMGQYHLQLKEGAHPRSLASLRALAHLRGSHIGVDAAEAFVLIRESA